MNKKLLILLVVAVIIWYGLSATHCNTNEYLTVCDGDNCASVNKGKIITDRMTDESIENASLLTARCSASCCDRQWPAPFRNDSNDSNDSSGSNNSTGYGGDFVQSGYTCNNSQDNTGCLCMTRYARNVLSNRGIIYKNSNLS